jgi:predicted nucleic acid-binding protein
MVSSSPSYFLDSNILVYAFDARDVSKRRKAMNVVNRLAELENTAVSPQVLGETYFSLTHRSRLAMDPDEAEPALEEIISLFEVLEVGLDAVRRAMSLTRRFQLRYWDALIVATAQLHEVPTVLSENFQIGQVLGQVTIVNPFHEAFDITSLG